MYIVDYKDDATAFNGLKKGTIVGKGVINNRVTNHLMQHAGNQGHSHPLCRRSFPTGKPLVKKVSIVPLEVIVRNIAAGSFAKRLGVPEGIEAEEHRAGVLL